MSSTSMASSFLTSLSSLIGGGSNGSTTKLKALAAAAACASLISQVILPFIFAREGTVKEDFPLHNTFRLLWHKDDILDFILEWTRYVASTLKKDTFALKALGLPQFVFTNNVANVEYILKTNFDNYIKGPQMKFRFQGLLGDGIFNADGALWYLHRKTSSALFNMNKFRGVVLDTFNEHAGVVIQLLEKSIGSEKGIDFQALMFKYTLDSIGKIAFGQDIGALHAENGVQFADDFDYVQEMTNQSFLDPFWWFRRYLTPSGWQYFSCLNRIDTYAFTMVNKVRKEALEGNISGDSSSKTLIGLYLAKQTEGNDQSMSSLKDRSNNDKDSLEMGTLTDTDLRDIIMNFIIAGRDTTAQALSWTFYRLSIHPDIQALARKEVLSVLSAGNNNSNSISSDASAWINFDQLKEMRYLDALCKEVLRLHPSVPKEAKHAMKDDTLPDKTNIKAGDLIIFCPWVMGRSESIWSDPETFNPERFIGTKPSPFQFTAFQAGPRVCLGQDLALLEMKCCIARLLVNFEFSLAQPKETVSYLNTLTLPIRNGLQVHVKRLAK